MECSVAFGDIQVRLDVIYRPPASKQNNLKNSVFFNEWSVFLEHVSEMSNEVIIIGDINFHLDNQEDDDARRLSDLLNIHSLVQHATVPTHNLGHYCCTRS